ncbi:putative F-box/LRR-repeat protein 23 isoform X2 [Panicum virgatum]|uniref:F-box domain-containing protein n=1 Tax=Panicum virgatum TaxID=38727 RepID=A0A8T0QW19_PANVG|nr:putative F-box/LRR-repeat protein 23 isoform X2 [Panicum virgatum]KAG2577304.1 hypothetical protein PVAP13_6NG107400 [Panicum virgatum]
MPSSSSRRQKPPTLAPAPGEARDWAALPQDILLAVFLKLGPLEIMQGAELVCTAWRRVAVDEPILWRRVDMGTVTTWSAAGRAMARAAVDRGEGQCEAFSGPCDSDLLLCLIERAPCLKSLHLSRFDGPNEALEVALKKIPLLEELEVSPLYFSSGTENLLESVCQACPLLTKLKMTFSTVPVDDGYYDEDLIREKIKGCFDGEMDTELRAKCARVKNLTIPDGSSDSSAEDYYAFDDCEWSLGDEFDQIDYGHHELPFYESWEIPYHQYYHHFCDECPEDD